MYEPLFDNSTLTEECFFCDEHHISSFSNTIKDTGEEDMRASSRRNESFLTSVPSSSKTS